MGAQHFPSPGSDRQLGNCRLLRELGSGGMGRVFLGELVTDRPYAPRGTRVAVKVIHPSLLGDEDLARRFSREAMIGSAVDHPSVVRTLEAGVVETDAGPQSYLVLEYVEGETLRDVIGRLGTLPESLLRDVALQVADGLHAIHSAGAIHRDMKPENVLITADHRVKIMDLGIAAVIGQDTPLTRTGVAIGTFQYAAPEQLVGEKVDARADLYALGVMLYEAASGVQPFAASNYGVMLWRHMEHVPPKLGTLDSRITPFVEEVVARLLEKDRTSRFESAVALATVLREGERSAWWGARASTTDQERRDPLRRLVATDDTAFVGRRDEFAALRGALEEAAAGRGVCVLLEGEAGIGKTRLIAELSTSGDLTRFTPVILYGRCARGDAAYGAITRPLVEHFGSAAVQRQLARLVSGPTALIARFAALVQGDSVSGDAERLSEETTPALFCELARNLARSDLLVWVIDDLEFASPELLRTMRALVDQLGAVRMLLIGTTRDEASTQPTGLSSSSVRRIRLAPLREAEVVQMVTPRVSRPLLADELGAMLAAKCDGNPLFVVETLRDMAAAGELQALDSGAAAITSRRSLSRIATSIREMAVVRLKSVTDEQRTLLDVASVQGWDFDPDLIARALRTPRLAVLQALATLERKTAVVRSVGSAFRFDHHELQHVVYDALPDLLRAEYHSILAAAYRDRLTERNESAADRHAVFLAEHLLRGHRPEDAESVVVPALEHLLRQYGQSAHLVELADLALAALKEGGNVLRCDVQLARSQALQRLGQVQDQRAAAMDARDAATAARDPARRARAALNVANSLSPFGEFEQSRATLAEAMDDARVAGDRAAEADILGAQGLVELIRGDMQHARGWFEQQIAVAHTIGDARRECHAYTMLSSALLGLGRAEESGRFCEQHLDLATTTGSREAEINALYGMAMAQLWRGDFGDARQTLDRQLEISRGSMHRTVLAQVGFVTLFLDAGQVELAEQHLKSARDRAAAAQLRHFTGYITMFAGDLASVAGDQAEARRLYGEAVGHARAIGVALLLADATFRLGRLDFHLGEMESASRMLSESNDVVEKFGLGNPSVLPAAYLSLMGRRRAPELPAGESIRCSLAAELHLVLHRLGEPGNHLARARTILDRMCHQLSANEIRAFWQNFPPARDYQRIASAT